jgi:hypothetical protein
MVGASKMGRLARRNLFHVKVRLAVIPDAHPVRADADHHSVWAVPRVHDHDIEPHRSFERGSVDGFPQGRPFRYRAQFFRAGQRAYVAAEADGTHKCGGRVIRILGKKNIRTDEPPEHVDTKILTTLWSWIPVGNCL